MPDSTTGSVPVSEPGSVDLPVTHPTPAPVAGPGPLHGIRVVEIAHPFTAFAGKLLADAGADVVLIEPPEGAEQRYHGPFAEGGSSDSPPSEMSLVWWSDNTSKRSVVADLETGPGRQLFRQLIETADVLVEGERPGYLADLGIDYPDLTGRPIDADAKEIDDPAPGPPAVNADLIHMSITPFGRSELGGSEDVIDLTLLARGGPMWSCGYDDHTLPPVRGRGGQGVRMSSHFAVMSVLTAILARSRHGGQFIDLSMVAAANVTTEFSSYGWLAARQTVQRQTGRHATPSPTEPTQVRCSDGRYLNTGVPPRTPEEFAGLSEWLTELGLTDEFPMAALLAMGSEYQKLTMTMIAEDPLAGEVFQAGREAMAFIASRVPAHEAFIGFQTRGIAAGVVWSPDEVMTDPHFVERGFPTEVYQPQLDRTVTYPGPPIRFGASPMAIRGPAPALGQHTDEVQGELDSQ
ncbi:MAG: CaiB/BaiF CoA transferase family protein [Acidimicrobiales bacterium]